MVTIRIARKFDNECKAELKICDRLNIVVGHSGDGKTHICSMLDDQGYTAEARDSKGNEVEIIYCSASNMEKFIEKARDIEKDYSVIVADEYLATNILRDKSKHALLNTMCKYFILFQRDMMSRFNVGVNSVFKVGIENGVYRLERGIKFKGEKISIDDIKSCNMIVIEDSKSGFDIFKHYFKRDGKMSVESSFGNGNLPDMVKEGLNKGNSIIVGLDYDMGASMLLDMEQIYSITTSIYGKLYFINMECMEELLCYSRLVSSKSPEIINILDNISEYTDCSYKHRGEFILKLLRGKFVIKNGKEDRPLYSKNNGNCFIRE